MHQEATQDFKDPLAVSVQDPIENGGQRWQTVGMTLNFVVLLVAHTVVIDDKEVIRIISAGKAE